MGGASCVRGRGIGPRETERVRWVREEKMEEELELVGAVDGGGCPRIGCQLERDGVGPIIEAWRTRIPTFTRAQL